MLLQDRILDGLEVGNGDIHISNLGSDLIKTSLFPQIPPKVNLTIDTVKERVKKKWPKVIEGKSYGLNSQSNSKESGNCTRMSCLIDRQAVP